MKKGRSALREIEGYFHEVLDVGKKKFGTHVKHEIISKNMTNEVLRCSG